MKSDEQIRVDVSKQLAANTRINASRISVSVHQGVVTLGGEVSSWVERMAAEESACRVAHVREIMNDLQVHLAEQHRFTDSELVEIIHEVLRANLLIPSDRIRVRLQDGVVTLEGTVDFWSQHDDVEQAVAKLRGVKELRNHIVVQPPAIGAQEVKGAIHEALDRRADRMSKAIDVAVHCNTVILSGTVSSAAERRAVETAVKGTAGVASIDNRLEVALG